MSDIQMNGPAEFEMKVWVINDKTGQSGQATVGLGCFEYPTKEKVKEKVDSLIDELEENGMEGFRLMTKQEAFEAWSIEKVGEPMALAAGPEWDEI
jgi:hypothetical protein